MKYFNNWKDVIDQITACDYIASSSLHGIILADAYGIPNVWIQLSNRIRGNGFKYRDYYEGCGKFNVECLNFTDVSIDTSIIEKSLEKYKRPHYNMRGLLKSCPFVSNERLRELMKLIN